jgi:undecaprenyl-diphosphatase
MKKREIIKIVGVIIFLSIFFLIIFNLNNNFIGKMDEKIYLTIYSINNEKITSLFKIITNFASLSVIIVILIICMFFVKNKRTKKILLFNAILVVALNQLIKLIIARPRPENINLIEENGFSFPSGHSMFSLAFYGLLIYYIYNSNFRKGVKTILIIILSLLIIFIPITRIYLGVHYASDVIAGLALSAALLLIYSLFKENI